MTGLDPVIWEARSCRIKHGQDENLKRITKPKSENLQIKHRPMRQHTPRNGGEVLTPARRAKRAPSPGSRIEKPGAVARQLMARRNVL
jgi:hypothetical protein